MSHANQTATLDALRVMVSRLADYLETASDGDGAYDAEIAEARALVAAVEVSA
ncbi:hypothetical protein [Achromobacter aegrifaciens]